MNEETTEPLGEVLSRLQQLLGSLPIPLRSHEDPTSPGTYYVSGPPETRIVADGLQGPDAHALVTIINSIPKIQMGLERAEENIRFLSGDPDFTPYVNTLREYATEIAQLRGTAAIIPNASKASELSFMHTGQAITIDGEEYFPVLAVKKLESGNVEIRLSHDKSIRLTPDYPVTINAVETVLTLEDGTDSVEQTVVGGESEDE